MSVIEYEDVKFWHLFRKSLPSLSILEEVSSRKKYKIEIKPLTFAYFYSKIFEFGGE